MKKSLLLVAVLALAAGLAAAEELALPSGTGVKMKLETAISTSTTKAGDTFAGRVTEPVMLGEKTVIPVGATMQGRVVRITEPRRVKGVPTIELHPETLTMPTGERFSITAVVVDTDKASKTTVSEEGKIKGRGHDRRDLLVGGLSAGTGAGIGAAAGGGKGALVGTLIGAAAGAGHWLWRRHSAELPAGTEITMELSRPMQMNSGASGR